MKGVSFELALTVPESYPLAAPIVRFKTKIFHPNIHWKVSIHLAFKKHLSAGTEEELPLLLAIELSYQSWGDVSRSALAATLFSKPICHTQQSVHANTQQTAPTSSTSDNVLLKPMLIADTLALQTGEVCLDILKTAWSPAWTLQSVCQAITLLLSDGASDSPLNCDAGNLLRAGDVRGYNSVARMYTLELAQQHPSRAKAK